MMEMSHSGKAHRNAVFVAALDDEIVADRSAGLCDVGNARLLRALDVIAKGEEGIRAKCYAADCIEVCSLLLAGEGRGSFGKVLLPVAVSANVFFVLVDVSVDNVISVGSAESILEGKVKNLVVLTEEPCISLCACKTCAMDT